MKARSGVVLAGVLAALWAAPLRAQNGTAPLDPQCAGGSSVFQDVCQKATDLYRLLAPQLGAVVAGGNATLGRVTPLGPGHWTLGLRIHVVGGSIPDLQNFPADTGLAKRTTFTQQSYPLPLPLVSGAIGLLPTIDVGGVRVGGLDALVNAAWLPNASHGSISVRLPGGSLKLGFGARIGLVDPPGRFPAVSATIIRRDLPTVDAAANFGANSDRVAVENLRVHTTAWRIVTGGSVGPVRLHFGGGRDRARSGMNLFVALQPPRCTYGPSACSGHPFEEFTQTVSRSQLFADASVHVWGMTLTLEGGRAGAISLPTYNAFGGRAPGSALWEGALGIRVGTGR